MFNKFRCGFYEFVNYPEETVAIIIRTVIFKQSKKSRCFNLYKQIVLLIMNLHFSIYVAFACWMILIATALWSNIYACWWLICNQCTIEVVTNRIQFLCGPLNIANNSSMWTKLDSLIILVSLELLLWLNDIVVMIINTVSI